jgi:hypothetical protein
MLAAVLTLLHVSVGLSPFFLIRQWEVQSSWVHSAGLPLIGLLYLPRVIMMMENLVE